jgi:hypothetical protein
VDAEQDKRPQADRQDRVDDALQAVEVPAPQVVVRARDFPSFLWF